jgi:hypothetical protein
MKYRMILIIMLAVAVAAVLTAFVKDYKFSANKVLLAGLNKGSDPIVDKFPLVRAAAIPEMGKKLSSPAASDPRTLETIRVLQQSGVSVEGSTKKPRVILYTIVPGADVILKDDYGYILINEGGEEHPQPRYILGIRSTGNVTDTKDINLFAKALLTIPKAATIFEYDSCTVSRSWGLNEKEIGKLNKVIKQAGLKISSQKRITCYCEALEKNPIK